MTKSWTRSLFLAGSMAVLAGAAGPALAQQAAQPATVQEIVVTAQRQSQSLLSVPMSISASTGEQLDKAGLRDLTSLQFTTPGYVPATSSGYTQLFIRGVGNNIFVGADPSVATFIDDVPRPYGSMVENFVDVERVEVLKGAQGGLYGRNATGGVVNIITRQPTTDSFHGDAKVSYGEKNTFQAAVYANMPINDKMAWSLAAERDSHDFYVKNIAQNPAPYTAAMFPTNSFVGTPQQTADALNSQVHPPKGLADQDFWAVDSKLLIKPLDNLKITLAGDYNRKHDSNGNQIVNVTPGYLQLETTALFPVFAGVTPNFPANFFQTSNGKFTAARGNNVFTNMTDYGGSATIVYSLPKVDLTSITAYRAQQTDFGEELGAAPIPNTTVDVSIQKWFLYQELRAISTDTGPIHYLAGATYLSNNFHGNTSSAVLPPLFIPPVTHVHDQIRNWSVYGQVGYDITQALNLTVSGRYVHETNEAVFTDPVALASSASMKETKFLPSATLSYKLDGGGNVYARWAKGFKAGGVNPVHAPAIFEPNLNEGSVFRPETVDTYEVGYRTPLFGRTVQLTTAAFYNEYKDLQVAAHGNAANPAIVEAIVNAGSARTWGLEESLTWRVNQAVTLGVNAGYLDAKFNDFAITQSTVLSHFDLSGQRMFNSPKWQLSLSGDLDQPVNDKFRLVGNILVSHLSSMAFLEANNPFVPEPSQPGYWLMNMRVGVRTTDDKYGVAIFANNLFNRGYYTFGSSNTEGNDMTWGTPRIVGVEATAKF